MITIFWLLSKVYERFGDATPLLALSLIFCVLGIFLVREATYPAHEFFTAHDRVFFLLLGVFSLSVARFYLWAAKGEADDSLRNRNPQH